MKIGYAVQGATDRAFVRGLRDRWCPDAELIEGAFRGSTGLSLRRELAKVSADLFHSKRCDILVFVSDADSTGWRDVQRREVARLPDDIRLFTAYGMADRNIECWLCADPAYIAARTSRAAEVFKVADPKSAFQQALGISRDDKKEQEIADLISEAQVSVLRRWLSSRSFEDFYDQLRTISKSRDCHIENLREAEKGAVK